jgi:hypothetical protein
MSPTEEDRDRESEPADTRLKAHPDKVTAARDLLAEIDRTVFPTSSRHRADEHAALVARAVRKLFGRD